MADEHPFASYNFQVTIDGLQIQAGFSEVSGLTMDNDVIEYRSGKDLPHMRKQPGMRKFTNIVMKRGFTTDKALYDWRKMVIDSDKPYRYSGSITLLGEDRKPALTWSFTNGWPNKLEGPSLNAKNSEVAIETLEIVVETLEFKPEG
ncbi:MAG: phage tail protein [Planctomycetota bacterium]